MESVKKRAWQLVLQHLFSGCVSSSVIVFTTCYFAGSVTEMDSSLSAATYHQSCVRGSLRIEKKPALIILIERGRIFSSFNLKTMLLHHL